MTVTAQHPAFMIIIDLQQAREDIDKAIDLLEARDSLSAATRVKLATQNLAKTASEISMMIARGRIGPDGLPEQGLKLKLREITGGDHMPKGDFMRMLQEENLDGDTTIDLATSAEVSNFSVRVYEMRNGFVTPAWATHVVVYSK